MKNADGSGIPAVDLNEKSLLEEAARNTGFSDYGDNAFRNGLQVLLAALEGEAKLNDFGHFFAHREILRHLENRLKVIEDWKRYPEMGEVEIVKPIFVVSPPRSGSTILHELLAQDPDNRYVATWECNLPSPPPETATYETDPRIRQWEMEMAGSHASEVPDFEAMHPMGARLPEECLVIMAQDFKSQVFSYQFNVPSYEAWLEQQDLLSVYATHKRQLQYMQWRCPRERWVLKAVGHLWGLKEIFEIYPDARIVQTHRDPLKMIASLTSLMSLGLSMTGNPVDSHAVGVQWAESWVKALEKAIAFRDSGKVEENRFFDLHYRESVKDPVAMVGKIYAYFGINFSEEAERRMRDFLTVNPKDKHGAHSYSLEKFGLDPKAERDRYRFYTERFEIEEEVKAMMRKGSRSDYWEEFCEQLKEAGQVLWKSQTSKDELTLAEGYRHLIHMLRNGFEITYDYADPMHPQFAPAYCATMLSEGVTSDGRYDNAMIDGSATYRISGKLGGAALIEFSVYAGKIGLQDTSRQLGFLTERELVVAEDGTFEVVLSPEEHAGNWICTTSEVNYLLIRQYSHDWSVTEGATLDIRCEGAPGHRPPARLAEVQDALMRTAAFVKQSPLFWTALVDRRAEGEPNVFQAIVGEESENSPTMPVGHKYSFGFFRLASDDVLIVELLPSDIPYWGLELTNYWFEPLSYEDHRSHINNRTAVYEPDGSVRIMISNRSSDVPNWLDTLGHREGTMVFRWSRSRDPIPPIASKVVKIQEL